MTPEPQDPTRHVPVSDIIPSHSDQPLIPRPAERGGALTIPAETHRPYRRRPRWGWLIGGGGLLVLIGIGLWYWWTFGTDPVHYKTATVDRGPDHRSRDRNRYRESCDFSSSGQPSVW